MIKIQLTTLKRLSPYHMQWTVTVLGRKLPASLTFPALVFSAFYTASLLYSSAVLRSPVKIAPILFPPHSALSNWPHNTKNPTMSSCFKGTFILFWKEGAEALHVVAARLTTWDFRWGGPWPQRTDQTALGRRDSRSRHVAQDSPPLPPDRLLSIMDSPCSPPDKLWT